MSRPSALTLRLVDRALSVHLLIGQGRIENAVAALEQLLDAAIHVEQLVINAHRDTQREAA